MIDVIQAVVTCFVIFGLAMYILFLESESKRCLYQRSAQATYELDMFYPSTQKQGYTLVDTQLLLFMRWLCEEHITITPKLIDDFKYVSRHPLKEEEAEEDNDSVYSLTFFE